MNSQKEMHATESKSIGEKDENMNQVFAQAGERKGHHAELRTKGGNRVGRKT
jgi:hypothetical protein